ncbi:MAG TPA: hypothetical protein VJ831_01670 [Jatrophihabitantaceae bacterium]|nr:hypothetical protein [Jatrophihabitantaceae bacterium]
MALARADIRRASIGALLLIVGLLLCALYRIVGGTEHHAYSSGSLPPQTAHLTAGTEYLISVRGGVDAILKRGGVLTSPQCEWSTDDSPAQALSVTPYGANTKATNTVATFVAPITGDLHVSCVGWGSIFIDDADDSSSDVAGWLLVVGVGALLLGGGLAVSALRASSDERASAWAAGQNDKVERPVDAAVGGVDDDEVTGPYGAHFPS